MRKAGRETHMTKSIDPDRRLGSLTRREAMGALGTGGLLRGLDIAQGGAEPRNTG